jgi:pimeloyl-ACP methyl ester carboxylesterase
VNAMVVARLLILAAAVLVPLPGAWAQDGEIIPAKALVLGPLERQGRTPVHTDPVESLVVSGKWRSPSHGDEVALPGAQRSAWKEIASDGNGSFKDEALSGGYALVTIELGAPRTLLLDASAHSMVYVNGEPRMGDPYETGCVKLPVRLPSGRSDLLFLCGRGHLRVRLTDPPAPAWIDASDATLPDILRDDKGPLLGAVLVVNAGDMPLKDASIIATGPDGSSRGSVVPEVPALGMRKVRVDLPRPGGDLPANAAYDLVLARAESSSAPVHLNLRVRNPADTRKITFISGIDGSVQYYALCPASRAGAGSALVLSLHGASVEAISQADAYSSKPWCDIVAPTNRRPYGFDWEDWGRMDAMEVLGLAQRTLHTDPTRVYLTGHSMGGHGSWQLATRYPDRFAAVGPSAGWISFRTYGGGTRAEATSDVEALLQSSADPSDTLALVENLASMGVYILHGDKDDNVPVEQARRMRDRLATFHHDLWYHEQPGAGHWWESSDEPGAECVDWAPMFDLFARRRLPAPEEVRHVSFRTTSPGVSSECSWAAIETPEHCSKLSSVDISVEPHKRRFTGTTENVARLRLTLARLPDGPGPALTVELDGQHLGPFDWPLAGHPFVWFTRSGGHWSRDTAPNGLTNKTTNRCGPFKDAFRNRPTLVYGTHGSLQENAWARAKARYDAECFWYRGNASFDVVADDEFNPRADAQRNVILYGNADTNSAWNLLLEGSPVQIARGRATAGDHSWDSPEVACLMIRPRPGSEAASVGVVGGAGIAGMRLTDRLPYFTSGVFYPDFVLLSPEVLITGARGVLADGFFGSDWSIQTGDVAFSEVPTSPALSPKGLNTTP